RDQPVLLGDHGLRLPPRPQQSAASPGALTKHSFPNALPRAAQPSDPTGGRVAKKWQPLRRPDRGSGGEKVAAAPATRPGVGWRKSGGRSGDPTGGRVAKKWRPLRRPDRGSGGEKVAAAPRRTRNAWHRELCAGRLRPRPLTKSNFPSHSERTADRPPASRGEHLATITARDRSAALGVKCPSKSPMGSCLGCGRFLRR